MMRHIAENIDLIIHNYSPLYMWFYAYVTHSITNSSGQVGMWFFCLSRLPSSSWKNAQKKPKNVNKNRGTNLQSHYLYFIFLIGLNVCYFTWWHIYLGNKINALHNLIKPCFREGLNSCKSSGFRVCVLLFLNKRGKREKNEQRR